MMSKGFIGKTTSETAINRIKELAREYRKEWKVELCQSEDIEKYGENEFIGAKAEAYEECLEILNER